MGTKVTAEQTSYVDGALAGCIMKVLFIWRRDSYASFINNLECS